MLWNKLSLAKAHLGTTNSWLHHAKKKAYKRGFKEYKALAVQILPSVKVSLLQIPIPAKSSMLRLRARKLIAFTSLLLGCNWCNLYFLFALHLYGLPNSKWTKFFTFFNVMCFIIVLKNWKPDASFRLQLILCSVGPPSIFSLSQAREL